MTPFAIVGARAEVAAGFLATFSADPGCQVSEVSRLLWTMIVLAALASIALVIRPRLNHAAILCAADLVWLWIDMEGPVLISRGTHGIHLADVPVLVTTPALLICAVQLLLRRQAH